MKKILVSGASGYAGRQVLEPLLKKGYEVHALYRSSKELPLRDGNIRWHAADFLDPFAGQELIAEIKADSFLHMAWDVTHGKFWESSENFKWLEASKAWARNFIDSGGSRIVGAGTCAEYQWGNSKCVENENLFPETTYGRVKLELYKELEKLCTDRQVSFSWGRIFFSYGPFEYQERMVPYVINGLLKDQEVECTHGEQVRDFLHIKDLGDAFAELTSSNVQGAVNIGSGEEITQKSVINEISKQLNGDDKVKLGAREANDPPYLVPDVSRLFNELKWKPKISLIDGIAQTIDWWKSKK